MGGKKKPAPKKADPDDPPMVETLQDGYEAGWDYRESTERLKKYKEQKKTNKEVYLAECERQGKKPNSQLANDLEESKPGEYTMEELNLNGNIIGNITLLLDLIRLNKDISKILLKDNGIQNNAVPLLCQVLVEHPSVATIDLTGNKHVGYVGGKALLMLAQRNPNVCSIRINKTGVPPNTKEKVESQALMNFNKDRISRTDYLSVRTDFRTADKNKDGSVLISELLAHERRKLEMQLLQKHPKKSGDKEKDKAAEKERAKKMKEGEEKIKGTVGKMFEKLDRDGDQKLSQAEFMRFYFSNIPEKTLQLFIDKYDNEEKRRGSKTERLTEDQVIALFDKYDVDKDGGLTKKELCDGVPDSIKGDVDAIFKEYDLDGGDVLGLGEFMMFMAKQGAL